MNEETIRRTRVVLHEDHISHVSSTDFPHQYPGEDLAFNLETFKKNFRLKIWKISPSSMEFDIIGIDASIANALRRILIAEVPTMAIENVFMMNNTSVIQDEVLAHRLGLIPIKADPTKFDFHKGGVATDVDTIVMKLNVQCKPKPKRSKDDQEPYIDSSIYSSHLEFDPRGDQLTLFKDNPIRPVHDDILIAKLIPGQSIEAELHLRKGCGREHAKWSPVATASYRLMPDIILKEDIVGDLADKFVSCFPEGVAEVVVENGVRKAKVINPRKCTMSREVLRHPELADKVILTRVRDHFLFKIESTGILPPQDLLVQAINILIEKCTVVKRSLGNIAQ
ncbi:RBP11-like subunits of RNA polymerase [Neoconidiobolus thromboides FSU 785]|nr:RBP11-like subunits of RNA polymerase [Neoconidiobolus thromboides FSU 785]